MMFVRKLLVTSVIVLSAGTLSFTAQGEEEAHRGESAGQAVEHAAPHGADHAVAAGHHAAVIPMSVTFQAINFAIYIGLLLYFLRKPISQFFRDREQKYKQALVRAENARRDAEKKKREIQQRLRTLDSTASESLEQARAEAEALKQQIRQDAESLAERLRTEANRTAQLELERARSVLREELLKQAVEVSRKLLADKMADGDQKRLQTEFVDKIQEVR